MPRAARALTAKGHKVAREFSVMVYFQGDPLARESIDMVVDDKIVVENKSAVRLRPDNYDQLLSYLTSTYLEVGLLLHFGPIAKFYRKVYENRLKAHGRKYPAPQL